MENFVKVVKQRERRVNGDPRPLTNIINVIDLTLSPDNGTPLKRSRLSYNFENSFSQQFTPPSCRRSLLKPVNKPEISYSQKSITSTTLNSNVTENSLPVITNAPYLYRNHKGYKILSADGTLEDIKDAVSVETQIYKPFIRNMGYVNAKRERLEKSVVELKTRLLGKNAGNDVLVFEFFKIVGGFEGSNQAKCDIFICGVQAENGITKYKEKLLTCNFYGEKNEKNPVVEFIPPKPSSEFDELYLYVEAEFHVTPNMKDRTRKRSFAEHSGTSSSSVTTQAYGTFCIAKKNKKKGKDESPWITNFKKSGVPLIGKEKINSNDIVKLLKDCQARDRVGGNASLSFEISNENGYGCLEVEEKKIKKSAKLLKKRKTDAKIAHDKGITYDVSQLIEKNMLLFSNTYTPTPKNKEKKDTRKVLKEPLKFHNQPAHEEGTRTFKCLFCSKTFSNFDFLKFHLEHTYPSFTFTFTKSFIKISYNVETSQEIEKLKSGATEGLIKNRIIPIAPVVPENAHPPIPLVHKRLINFPYRCNTQYSKVPAPTLGLYGHEIPMHFFHQAIKVNLNDFEDVEEKEKIFYFLWNTFNAERSNRRIGMLSMYDRLLKFIQKNYDKIEKFNLKSVWSIFVLYFKNLGIINERQFFIISFYRTPLENKWFGCNAPLIKD